MEKFGDVEGRVATGLTRLDVFNWFKHVSEQVQRRRVDTVVFCFGGNDDHDLMTGLPDGVSLDGFGGPKWTKEYQRRVGGLMDIVNQAGGFVVWLGLPITDDDAPTPLEAAQQMAFAEAQRARGRSRLRGHVRPALAERRVRFLPGEREGELEKVRAPDGVHLERAGGDMVARRSCASSARSTTSGAGSTSSIASVLRGSVALAFACALFGAGAAAAATTGGRPRGDRVDRRERGRGSGRCSSLTLEEGARRASAATPSGAGTRSTATRSRSARSQPP